MTKYNKQDYTIQTRKKTSRMKTYYFLLPNLEAGGAERVSITIARILKKQGKDVKFVNLGYHNGEMKSWIEPEFELISLGCKRVLSAFNKLLGFFKDKPDAVLFSSREHLSIVSIVVAKKLNLPIIIRVPNMPNNKLAKNIVGRIKERTIKTLNKYLLPYAKKIIAQNDEMSCQLKRYYRLSDNQVITINNPVDKDHVLYSAKHADNPLPQGKINFLNICNISYAKGIDVLLDAFPKVKQVIPNAHLTIVGRTNSDYAKEIVARVEHATDIKFVGFQNNPYPYLKYCDVFVLPSRMEGFPNVVIEAMCFNKPIVSTTCVDVIKAIIVPGTNGFYCNIEDAEALAQCMIRAISLRDIQNDYNLFDLDTLLKVFN